MHMRLLLPNNQVRPLAASHVRRSVSLTDRSFLLWSLSVGLATPEHDGLSFPMGPGSEMHTVCGRSGRRKDAA